MLKDRELAETYVKDADRLEEAGRESARCAYRTAMGVADESGFH